MDEEHLDTSWLDPILTETQSTTCPKSTLMDSVSVSCIFVNDKREIIQVKKEVVPLDHNDDSAVLSEGRLLEIIQRNRCLDDKHKRYAFDSMKQFTITMDANFLTDFIHNTDNHITRNTFTIPQKVAFPRSVFLYHDINCLWLLFYEMERVIEPKSILKQAHVKKRVTKKVRISDSLPSRYGTVNKTKRQK
jgi:hypothetical protein